MRAVLVFIFLACGIPPVQAPTMPSQPTLWLICYDEEGNPEYYETPQKEYACDSPERVVWDGIPIKVYLHPSVTDATNAFLWAFKEWENWLGAPVFELVPDDGPGVVVAFQAKDPFGLFDGVAAMAPHKKLEDGSREHAVLFFGEHRFNPVIIAHEFGHVLGLAHDREDKNSIMFPSVGAIFPKLQADDYRVLCELYRCNENYR